MDNNIIAEFCRYNPLIRNHLFAKNFIRIINDRQTVFLNLKIGKNILEKGFHNTVGRNIKTAKNSGLTIEYNRINGFKDFMLIYYHTMDRVKSASYYFFNEDYFENLFKIPSTVTVDIIHENKVIASAFCFVYKKYFHYHLGASYTSCLDLRPNDLMFYGMIQYGLLSGCNYFHLGGGNSPAKDDGLFRFKKKFSNEKRKYFISKKVYNQNIYNCSSQPNFSFITNIFLIFRY